MANELEKQQEQKAEVKAEKIVETEVNEPERKVSKAWEAAQRLKGRVIVTDSTLFYR
ncbi:MAG: hypothetical protein Q4D41_01735 [Prevotellaceae bacterium]|nr:hypothetical protein [Prevotellaceae bacterium]